MSCKVNFHVVRLAVQCSMCLNGIRVFRPFQRKTFGSYGTSEKVVRFSGWNVSNENLSFIFSKRSLIPVSGLPSRFSVKGTDLYKW